MLKYIAQQVWKLNAKLRDWHGIQWGSFFETKYGVVRLKIHLGKVQNVQPMAVKTDLCMYWEVDQFR